MMARCWPSMSGHSGREDQALEDVIQSMMTKLCFHLSDGVGCLVDVLSRSLTVSGTSLTIHP